jgi:apolipoprotein N-acyltransferase
VAVLANTSLTRTANLPGTAGHERLPLVRARPAPPTAAATVASDRPALGTTVAFALAALGGVAFAAAFPPLDWSAAAWLALVPLLVACASLTPARAAIAGLCWTLGAAAILARFLPEMLSGYFGLAPYWSWLATLGAVVVLHGAFIAAFAAWVAWLVRRRAARPLLVASGWVACELARTHGELGSPWGLFAYSQIREPVLVQIADVVGAYGIGFVMAAVSASVAAAIAPRLRVRRLDLRWSASVVATLVAALLGYGTWCLQHSFADGETVRVAVVQAGAPTRDPALRAERLARHVALSSENDPARRADVVVWPESALDGYLQERSATRTAVLDLARRSAADLVVGGPRYERDHDGTHYFNSAFLVRGDDIAARYDKHRLVPFAEDGRGASGGGSSVVRYTAGEGTSVLPARGLHAGILLCFEAMFPALARDATHDGADVLFNLSNDGWFARPEAAQMQLDIATLRAVENRRFLVRAAATGISAVIDPQGRILERSAFGTHEVLDASVRPSHARTLYQRWGDAPAWLLIAAAVLASLRVAIRSSATVDERKI